MLAIINTVVDFFPEWDMIGNWIETGKSQWFQNSLDLNLRNKNWG